MIWIHSRERDREEACVKNYAYLKYIILIATVVSAVFTPSTDPVTQIIFAGAILILYLLGAGLVFYFEKYKIIY